MAYDDLMRLAAAYERLRCLEEGLTQGDADHRTLMKARGISKTVPLSGAITLTVPDGTSVREFPINLHLVPGTLTVICGPSGVGKSTLLKVLAGFRGGFAGVLETRGTVFWMPQQTYLPKGTLKSAVTYPKLMNSVTDERVKALFEATGLSQLSMRLHDTADWATVLSGGEQQRLSLCQSPKYC